MIREEDLQQSAPEDPTEALIKSLRLPEDLSELFSDEEERLNLSKKNLRPRFSYMRNSRNQSDSNRDSSQSL